MDISSSIRLQVKLQRPKDSFSLRRAKKGSSIASIEPSSEVKSSLRVGGDQNGGFKKGLGHSQSQPVFKPKRDFIRKYARLTKRLVEDQDFAFSSDYLNDHSYLELDEGVAT